MLNVGKSAGFDQSFLAERLALQGVRTGAPVEEGLEGLGPVDEPEATSGAT
jgi:hypothetical protein